MKPSRWNPQTKSRMDNLKWFSWVFALYIGSNLYRVQGKQIYQIQGKKAIKLAQQAREQHVGEITLPALRGAITDRNRQILAASLTQPTVAANPTEIKKVGDVAYVTRYLSRLLHMKESEVHRLVAGPGVNVYIKRKVSEGTVETLKKAIEAEQERFDKAKDRNRLAGLFVQSEPTGLRFYPKGRLASHILGYTGIDDNGLDGIESQFDQVLRGKPGKLVAEMDNLGRALPNGMNRKTPADPGKTVVLTIDEPMQYLVERELATVVKKQKAKGAICIVMDVRNADVLAMATYPDFATREFNRVPAAVRRNRAICDAYEPGSTFKVALAAAALDSKKIGLYERFFCGNTIMVDGWPINNADDGASSKTGTEDITGIMTWSFNVGTTSVAFKMGKRTYFDYLCKFGFGEQTGIALPGEGEGIVQPLKDWANVTLATNSFGQGVAVTPMQLVQCMQTVANKGVMLRPRIVKELLDPDGKVVKAYPPVVKRRVLSEETAMQMRGILRAIVTNGTGKKAEIAGFPSAGKTGTAQVSEYGRYQSGRYIASFLGMAPYNDPRIVVLVKVEEPHNGAIWGGAVAAPVFAKVARACLWRLGAQPQVLDASSQPPPEKED